MARLPSIVVVLLLAASAGATACSSGPERPGPDGGTDFEFTAEATIVIDDDAIEPALTTARVGDTLTVVNRGTRAHGLTSTSIDTGTLQPGESTTVFLTETGTVELHDRADTTHTARIEVLER